MIYVDGVPYADFAARLAEQRARPEVTRARLGRTAHQMWASPARSGNSVLREILEVRLAAPRLVNYIGFSLAHYPHNAEVEVWDPTLNDGEGFWREVAQVSVTDSMPQFLPRQPAPGQAHPQHDWPGHWFPVSFRIDAVTTRRVRLVLYRAAGQWPRDTVSGEYVDYSLAVRSFDVGYRVTRREDIPVAPGETLAATRDLFGRRVEYAFREMAAGRLTDGDPESGPWRSRPQPVPGAVVNLYLDVRSGGAAQVFDEMRLDPLYIGASLTVYVTEDDFAGTPTDDDYAAMTWRPVPRDYKVHRSPLHLPSTRARFVKLEMTNLTPQPLESLLLTPRTVRTHPAHLAQVSRPPERGLRARALGEQTHIDRAAQVTPDTETAVRRFLDRRKRLATEALHAENPSDIESLREASWRYGFMRWHGGYGAPRFAQTGKHVYETAEIAPTTKLAFFAGLKGISLHRTTFTAQTNTRVYAEDFLDAANFTGAGDEYGWDLQDDGLTTGDREFARVVSVVHGSRNPVKGLQFATQQSPMQQIAIDDELADPALALTSWDDLGTWHRYNGVGHLTYDGDRQTITVDRSQDAEVVVGVESPEIPYEYEGRVYVAARVIAETDLTAPLYAQIVNYEGTVVAEKAIDLRAGQTGEWWTGWTIRGGAYETGKLTDSMVRPVVSPLNGTSSGEGDVFDPTETWLKIRVIQKESTDDVWTLDTLSLFTRAIQWEFTVDGTNWIPALEAANNADGMVTFPTPGDQLQWRVTGRRPGQRITSLQIRPYYTGEDLPASTRPWRGANVSTYDQYPPVHEDPRYTAWTRPIPRWWFQESLGRARRPVVYTRLREAREAVPEPVDAADRMLIIDRFATEEVAAPTDDADRYVDHGREATEEIPVPDESRSTDRWIFRTLVAPLPHAVLDPEPNERADV